MFSFKKFFESYQAWHWLFVVRCDSAGWHGGRGEEDVPAGNPKQERVIWQSMLNGRDSDSLDPKKVAEADRVFRGSEVMVYENPETGSYHERFQNIHVFIHVSEEQIDQADIPFGYSWDGKQDATLQSSGVMKDAKQVGKFQYQSLHDVIEQVVRICKVKPPANMPTITAPPPQVNIPHTNLSPDAWWKDRVNRTIPVNNKRKDLDGE